MNYLYINAGNVKEKSKIYVTPESGPNLMYWNFLPMGVTNYGGDLQIFELPEYTAAPLQFNLNPIGLNYVSASAIEKELRQIATNVGELNTKISKAATEAAQVARNSQSQLQSAHALDVSNESTNANQSTVSADLNCELKPGLFKGRLAGQEATVVRICKNMGFRQR